MRVLLIEDEPEIARVIVARLGRSGFAADRVGRIEDALVAARTQTYALTVLDRRLPDGDGVDIIAELRRLQPGLRVLVLTACDRVDERITGLDAGADDYMTKPFDVDELMARIRASLRRPGGEPPPAIEVGALRFDPGRRELSVAGAPVLLHKRELALIDALARNAGRVVLRAALVEEVYGFDDDVQSNALNIIVSRLRRRLEELGAGVDIHVARGVGYMLCKGSADSRDRA